MVLSVQASAGSAGPDAVRHASSRETPAVVRRANPGGTLRVPYECRVAKKGPARSHRQLCQDRQRQGVAEPRPLRPGAGLFVQVNCTPSDALCALMRPSAPLSLALMHHLTSIPTDPREVPEGASRDEGGHSGHDLVGPRRWHPSLQ